MVKIAEYSAFGVIKGTNSYVVNVMTADAYGTGWGEE